MPGPLHHGSDLTQWLRGVHILLQTLRTSIANAPVAMNSEEKALHIIKGKIEKTLLDRIPDAAKMNVDDLLSVLPIYCTPFRFMDLSPELRLHTYQFVDMGQMWTTHRHIRKLAARLSLLRVCRSIRKEIIPIVIPRVEIFITNSSQYPFLAPDANRYLTTFYHWLETQNGRIYLRLRAIPGRAVSYELFSHFTRWKIILRAFDTSGRFENNLLDAIRVHGLDGKLPGYRGHELIALVRVIPQIYMPEWLESFHWPLEFGSDSTDESDSDAK